MLTDLTKVNIFIINLHEAKPYTQNTLLTQAITSYTDNKDYSILFSYHLLTIQQSLIKPSLLN